MRMGVEEAWTRKRKPASSDEEDSDDESDDDLELYKIREQVKRQEADDLAQAIQNSLHDLDDPAPGASSKLCPWWTVASQAVH